MLPNKARDRKPRSRASRPFGVGQADLGLEKTMSDTAPEVGDVVTFTIVVTNDGPNDATGVDVRDRVPAGYTGITNPTGPVVGTITALAPG